MIAYSSLLSRIRACWGPGRCSVRAEAEDLTGARPTRPGAACKPRQILLPILMRSPFITETFWCIECVPSAWGEGRLVLLCFKIQLHPYVKRKMPGTTKAVMRASFKCLLHWPSGTKVDVPVIGLARRSRARVGIGLLVLTLPLLLPSAALLLLSTRHTVAERNQALDMVERVDGSKTVIVVIRHLSTL